MLHCAVNICLGNHTVAMASLIWKFRILTFFKKSHVHSYSKLNEKNINNIITKELAWTECRKIFLEAIFPSSGTFFFKDFHHHFTRYHWLRKFPIVSQPIIIQNDV